MQRLRLAMNWHLMTLVACPLKNVRLLTPIKLMLSWDRSQRTARWNPTVCARSRVARQTVTRGQRRRTSPQPMRYPACYFIT